MSYLERFGYVQTYNQENFGSYKPSCEACEDLNVFEQAEQLVAEQDLEDDIEDLEDNVNQDSDTEY